MPGNGSSFCGEALVASNEALGVESETAGYHLLRLTASGWPGAAPGRFVMLRAQAGPDVILARPISVCVDEPSGPTLFFQVVGRGTAALARLAPGDRVELWGPLGNGFAVEPDTPTLLLAGGMGLAPFVGYVAAHPRLANLSLVFGHRASLDCYPMHLFNPDLDLESRHEQRPEDLEAFLAHLTARIAEHVAEGLVLACGPEPFLRFVQAAAARVGARAQISLERRMACGVGACLGCVARSKGGWPVQVCSRGPVFWAKDISLEGR